MVMRAGSLGTAMNRFICDNGDVTKFVCTVFIPCLILRVPDHTDLTRLVNLIMFMYGRDI